MRHTNMNTSMCFLMSRSFTVSATTNALPSVTKKLDLFLVRHAESTNNVLNGTLKGSKNLEKDLMYARQADCGISPRGKEQLQQLTAYIKSGGWNMILNNRPTTFYSSPMLRCLETAHALTSGMNASNNSLENAVIVNVKKDLYEVGGCYGLDESGQVNVGLCGSTSAEIEKNYSNFKCLPGMEAGWYDKPLKETKDEFNIRVGGIAEWLWGLVEETNVDVDSEEEKRGSNQAVLVVHGHLITTLMNYLLFKEPKSCLFVHHNTGITHIQLTVLNGKDRVGAVQYSNNTDHLHSPHPLSAAGQCTYGRSYDDSGSNGGWKGQSLRSGNELVVDRWVSIFHKPNSS